MVTPRRRSGFFSVLFSLVFLCLLQCLSALQADARSFVLSRFDVELQVLSGGELLARVTGVRKALAHAIGVSGFDAATEAKLFDKLKDVEVRNNAAVALILGGSAETAARTVAMYGDFDKGALDELKDQYFQAFGYWSDEDFKRGNLYRWVQNATAITHVKVNDTPQDWARERLQAQFDNLKFDNGPHSETRIVLRYRLYDAARKGSSEQKKGAIDTLKFMKEKGVLMALRFDQGLTGELAQKAFFELMNPKAISGDDLKALQAEQDSKMKEN